MSPPQSPPPPVLIAVMGETGSGKSSFINLATQSERLRVGHTVTSCTSTVDRADPFELDGRQVILYDTPGFNDTTKSESTILQIIASELETQYRAGYKLHGIIYIRRISDLRVGGIDMANFHIFKKLCGTAPLKNVVIMTNMWSKVTEAEGEKRVRELRELDDYFKPVLEKGTRMMHHKEETVESAHRVIRAIMEKHPIPLIIQEELVDQGKDINQTSAGQEVDKKMAELTAKFEKQLKEQKEAAEQARKEHDEETREIILKEAQKAEARIAKIEEERKNQAEDYKRLRSELNDMEARRRRDAEDYEKRRQADAEIAKREVEAIRKQGANALGRTQQAAAAPLQVLSGLVSGRSYSIYRYEASNAYWYLGDDDRIKKTQNYTGTRAQQWILFKHGDYWRIKSAYNNKYLCFDKDDSSNYFSDVDHCHKFSLSPSGGRNNFKVTDKSTRREWNIFARIERRT